MNKRKDIHEINIKTNDSPNNNNLLINYLFNKYELG